MLKAVFLDFGNTLVDETRFIPTALKGVVSFVRQAAGLSDDENILLRELTTTSADSSIEQKAREDIRTREYGVRVSRFVNFARKYDLTINDQFIGGMLNSYDQAAASAGLIEGAGEAVKKLSNSYKLAIVSNGYAGFVYSTLNKHNLLGCFSAIVVSQEVNVEKPDRKMFELAADRLDVNLKNVLMVGDSFEADVAGSKKWGMTNCWINVNNASIPDKSVCDFVVPRLADLPELLARNQNPA